MSIGYNMAQEMVGLHQLSEMIATARTNQTSDELNEIIDEIEEFQKLLSKIQADTDDSNRVDWSNNPEMIKLVDQMREKYGLDHVFAHGVYSWKGEKLSNMVDGLNRQINHKEPLMKQKFSDLNQITQEQSEILDIVATGIREHQKMIQNIMRNIQNAR